MKRYFALPVVVFALIGLVQIGSAGPEPLSGKEMKEVAPAPPECNWTGFYFGGLAGYARGGLTWSDTDTSDFPSTSPDTSGPTTLVDRNQSGFLGGGELGFNYQWNRIVFGLEGTFSYSDLQSHKVTDFKNADEPNSFDTRSDWQGTISGRAGFAWNKFLFYAKGGGAFVNQRYSWLHGDNESELVDTFKTDETRVGALVGGGIEYMINCHWSAKVEYNHFFLGTDTISGTRIDDGVGEPESYDVDLDQDSVQVGINYKFWGF